VKVEDWTPEVTLYWIFMAENALSNGTTLASVVEAVVEVLVQTVEVELVELVEELEDVLEVEDVELEAMLEELEELECELETIAEEVEEPEVLEELKLEAERTRYAATPATAIITTATMAITAGAIPLDL